MDWESKWTGEVSGLGKQVDWGSKWTGEASELGK